LPQSRKIEPDVGLLESLSEAIWKTNPTLVPEMADQYVEANAAKAGVSEGRSPELGELSGSILSLIVGGEELKI
jgi:hypothetical protein